MFNFSSPVPVVMFKSTAAAPYFSSRVEAWHSGRSSWCWSSPPCSGNEPVGPDEIREREECGELRSI